jgi:hypothetical protein
MAFPDIIFPTASISFPTAVIAKSISLARNAAGLSVYGTDGCDSIQIADRLQHGAGA